MSVVRADCWWTLSPRPPGINRFGLKRQGLAGRSSEEDRPTCRLQAPVGARVPSLESPILRWSKERVSRFHFPEGL